MIVAFTGPSRLTSRQIANAEGEIQKLVVRDITTVRSGCAYGVDTLAANWADLYGFDLELYVPAANHNDDLVKELAERSKVIVCDSGPEPYRIRNNMMVKGADQLIAFVKRSTFYRSGEWMTINIARKFKVPVEIKEI